MGFPVFRFLLSNEIEGDYPISEPCGWDDTVLKLERNEKYHSLVEFYEQPLTFYGANDNHDGGLDYIRNIENTQGVDADIFITIVVDFGDGDEILFNGLLDLSELKEIDSYKADIPLVRDDFWTKFINRSSTPVDVQSSTSLDGSDVDVLTPLDVELTAQILNERYLGRQSLSESISYSLDNTNRYGQIDFEREELSEIKEKFTLPRVSNTEIPSELLAVKYGGDYIFDIQIVTTTSVILGSATADIDIYLQINELAADLLSQGALGTPGLDGRTVHTYTGTKALLPGDVIKLYIENNTGGAYSFAIPADIFYEGSYLDVTAETEYPSTQTEALLIHDVAESIIQRTTENGIYSDYLGGTGITTETYSEDGCAYPFTLMRGLHIRQYSFSEKPFSLSFNDFWDGVDPIFCLGLGYEELSPKVQFKNRFFDTTINNWEQSTQGSTLQPFAYLAGGFALADGSSSGLASTARFGQTQYFGWPAGDYRIKVKAYNNSTGGSAPFASTFNIRVSNNSLSDGSSIAVTPTGDVTWNVGDDDARFYDFNLAANWDYLAFSWSKQGVSAGYECYIRIDFIEIVNYRIRIENRDFFYNKSSNSVNLSYVDNIERSYATDKIFKKIDIGYQKWESENISGIDDPQTKHTYSSAFKKVGEEIELYSKFIAASYAIESTRRQVIEKSKDYKLDNDTFILAVNPSASPVVPELDEYFTLVTNLNNPETRYNLRITPYWNFTNWLQWFSGSFTPLTSALWKFQKGEGNYDVVYTTDGACLVNFSSDNHAENADVSISNLDIVGSTFKLKVIEFEHPLSWADYKTIRQNRELTIGVSETNTGHESYFILSLKYQITKGKAKFKLLQAGAETLSVTFDSTVSTFDSTVLTFDME